MSGQHRSNFSAKRLRRQDDCGDSFHLCCTSTGLYNCLRGVIEQIHISGGGLPKCPIMRAFAGPLGLEGDKHAHPRFHGGPKKALLLITAEGIEELHAAGFPLFGGAMGENLTTRGLDRRRMRLGQRYRAGAVELELTSMRVPCLALDVYGTALRQAVYDARVKAGDPGSPRWGLGGFYAAVVTPGEIVPQDIIALADDCAPPVDATSA